MRLLETSTCASGIPRMRKFTSSDIPPYTILSHTWDQDEVSFQQLTSSTAADPASSAVQAKADFRKIQQTCAVALGRDKLEYAWYRDADVCYIFLADLEPGTTEDLQRDLPRCRYFTRGWTLQELIAPRVAAGHDALAELISYITGFPSPLLRHETQVSHYAVARRMSWAAKRETTRMEDVAYSLLGIFDVNMSLIYGEGIKAFARLQTAILQSAPDWSIFAWTDDNTPQLCAGVLAESPRQFVQCGGVELAPGDPLDFTITARGIQTKASLRFRPLAKTGLRAVAVLEMSCYGVGGGLYVRYLPVTRLTLESAPGTTLNHNRDLQLPHFFRFHHPGLGRVLGNRSSALQLNWGSFKMFKFSTVPRSHWDSYHGVFFACDMRSRGWCAVIASGSIPSSPGLHTTVRRNIFMFLACFGWNQGPITVMLAQLDSADRVKMTLLELKLAGISFDGSQHAETAITEVNIEHGPNPGTIQARAGGSAHTQSGIEAQSDTPRSQRDAAR
ncbi:hypothetical protein N658DRAFT_516894 [Parathielavia hyrcaniae]|uniref:DUF8212 domain-containing protein n=1 Tax=Parathielavia hyrcaniae TaxID=113614 RepID=A0AAN6Q2V6_9PEZI|nr:hypothetical protein N658DRAFT_516894 [Parathielavia hyrcaniae]